MYYGVIINGENMLDKYGLILAADVKDEPPSQRRETVKVAGTDGEVDLSYSLTGSPIFENRSLEFTLCAPVPDVAFMNLYREFKNAYHGKKCKVIMPWDLTRYYYGVFAVGEKKDYGSSQFSVEVDADPYLYSVLTDEEDGL